jgi:peroxiredoxin
MANQTVEVGDKAPDFALKDQNRNDVKLSDYRGKKVVLSWHPLAWTGLPVVS